MLCAGNIVQCLACVVIIYILLWVMLALDYTLMVVNLLTCILCKLKNKKEKEKITYYASSPVEKFGILSESLP